MNWERLEFIDYLVNTLIPDCIEGGQTGLAQDLIVAAYFIQYNNVNHAIHRLINERYKEIEEGVING